VSIAVPPEISNRENSLFKTWAEPWQCGFGILF
jgi:hypothetical protein